jgi:hypothetical protein
MATSNVNALSELRPPSVVTQGIVRFQMDLTSGRKAGGVLAGARGVMHIEAQNR